MHVAESPSPFREEFPYRQLAIVGCGLIGTSFAMAAREARLARRIVGFTLSAEDAADALRAAAVDAIANSAAEAVEDADLVLLAAPVGETAAVLRQIRPALAPDVLAMDVGSTKSDVAAAALAELGVAVGRFVPAHPIAGRETGGAIHAEASLFRGHRAILAPLAETRDDAVAAAAVVWQAVGAEVSTMTPADHDAAMAAVSHLPHLLAAAAVSAVATQSDAAALFALVGPGFRDFSRIAAGDAGLWRDILMANREAVLRQSSIFGAALEQFGTLLRNGDAHALEAALAKAARARRSLDRFEQAGSGSGTPSAAGPTLRDRDAKPSCRRR